MNAYIHINNPVHKINNRVQFCEHRFLQILFRESDRDEGSMLCFRIFVLNIWSFVQVEGPYLMWKGCGHDDILGLWIYKVLAASVARGILLDVAYRDKATGRSGPS